MADVEFETSIGPLGLRLYFEEAPLNTENFVKLCKLKYYNEQVIYLLETDVIVQLGDPTASGKGGSSIQGILWPNEPTKKFIKDEIPLLIKENRDKFTFSRKGIVAMANSGKNRNASQFFITLTDRELDFLQDRYTIIGEILEEYFPTLDKLNDEVLIDEDGRPFEDILITSTVVCSDPFPDPAGYSALLRHCVGFHNDKQTEVVLEHEDGHYLPHGKILKASYRLTQGLKMDESEQEKKRKAAESRALTLEMIGDIENAEVTPDDNVLFVCKLNPSTEEEDLALIFSRFGTLEECKLVRNEETGESLQYAFIRFQEKESCEEAYFKMNNALIDDRRIHVDFSQSTRKKHRK